MSGNELGQILDRLALSEAEAAVLLSVNRRSVRRWSDGSVDVPGPVEQALRAWLRLDELSLAWKPDGIPIWEERWKDQIRLFRDHSQELKAVIDKVEKRGGPAAPWQVDLGGRTATLGPIELSFHVLANESFSPSMYRRRDGRHDLKRDWPLLEDAFYCVAMAIGKAGKGWSEISR